VIGHLHLVDKSLGTAAITEWIHLLATTTATTAPVIWGLGINEFEALRLLRAGARGVVRRTSAPETLVTCLRSD
jgi:hypothetical protein